MRIPENLHVPETNPAVSARPHAPKVIVFQEFKGYKDFFQEILVLLGKYVEYHPHIFKNCTGRYPLDLAKTPRTGGSPGYSVDSCLKFYFRPAQLEIALHLSCYGLPVKKHVRNKEPCDSG